MSQNGYNDYFKKKRQTNKTPTPRAAQHKKSDNDWNEEIARSFLSISNKKKTNRQKHKAPTGAILVAVLLSAVGVLGYFYPQEFDRILGQFEFSMGDRARAQVAENKSATSGGEEEKKSTDAKADAAVVCDPKKMFSDEEVSHFGKLSERKKELDLREAELNALEEELHKQRGEVEARIDKLENIREEVSSVLKDRVEVDQQRVDRLVEFYSNMKPKQAAEIFGNLNEDLAVEVLGKMKKKNAADIMNLLEPAKARTLSEKFAGYKRK